MCCLFCWLLIAVACCALSIVRRVLFVAFVLAGWLLLFVCAWLDVCCLLLFGVCLLCVVSWLWFGNGCRLLSVVYCLVFVVVCPLSSVHSLFVSRCSFVVVCSSLFANCCVPIGRFWVVACCLMTVRTGMWYWLLFVVCRCVLFVACRL